MRTGLHEPGKEVPSLMGPREQHAEHSLTDTRSERPDVLGAPGLREAGLNALSAQERARLSEADSPADQQGGPDGAHPGAGQGTGRKDSVSATILPFSSLPLEGTASNMKRTVFESLVQQSSGEMMVPGKVWLAERSSPCGGYSCHCTLKWWRWFLEMSPLQGAVTGPALQGQGQEQPRLNSLRLPFPCGPFRGTCRLPGKAVPPGTRIPAAEAGKHPHLPRAVLRMRGNGT